MIHIKVNRITWLLSLYLILLTSNLVIADYQISAVLSDQERAHQLDQNPSSQLSHPLARELQLNHQDHTKHQQIESKLHQSSKQNETNLNNGGQLADYFQSTGESNVPETSPTVSLVAHRKQAYQTSRPQQADEQSRPAPLNQLIIPNQQAQSIPINRLIQISSSTDVIGDAGLTVVAAAPSGPSAPPPPSQTTRPPEGLVHNFAPALSVAELTGQDQGGSQQRIPSASSSAYSATPSDHHHQSSPLYLGHNPFIEILKPQSYADDNIVTLNLSHSHIYEIDSDAFVGQRFEHIDLSNNKLGLIHRRSFRIGPIHSRHNVYNPSGNNSKLVNGAYPLTRRPPPAHPKSVYIDFSHNPAIVALSGAFDHIDVPNCVLNFTNSTVELKFGAFKKYFKEHPGHLIDIDSVDCCEQEWLLGYKHNFLTRAHCEHDPSLFLAKLSQQQIIDSCIAYVTSARHNMNIQGPSIIHQVAASAPRQHSNSHSDNQQYLTYVILGGTAMILTSLSIYIIFYMFSLKAAFVYQMQNKT